VSILNAGAGGGWDDRCLHLDCSAFFEGVDRDDPELRAILAPEMERIRERVNSNPESDSKRNLLARLAGRGAAPSQI